MNGLVARWKNEKGSMNLTKLVLLVALVGVVYSAYKFGPVYLEFNRVKRLSRLAVNQWVNVEPSLEIVQRELQKNLDDAMIDNVTLEDYEFEMVDGEGSAYLYYEVEVEHPAGKPTVLEFEFEHSEIRDVSY